MSVTINDTTVRIGRDPEDWRKHQIVVQVASRVKKGLKAQQELDPGKAPNAQTLARGVGAAAALAAEHLGMNYGDTIDPSACARDAIQALTEEARLIANLAKDLPSKVRRLRENGSKFSEQERAILDRMNFLLGRGENLTRDEAEWVNSKIADLHDKNL